jgi:hypothetical protein
MTRRIPSYPSERSDTDVSDSSSPCAKRKRRLRTPPNGTHINRKGSAMRRRRLRPALLQLVRVTVRRRRRCRDRRRQSEMAGQAPFLQRRPVQQVVPVARLALSDGRHAVRFRRGRRSGPRRARACCLLVRVAVRQLGRMRDRLSEARIRVGQAARGRCGRGRRRLPRRLPDLRRWRRRRGLCARQVVDVVRLVLAVLRIRRQRTDARSRSLRANGSSLPTRIDVRRLLALLLDDDERLLPLPLVPFEGAGDAVEPVSGLLVAANRWKGE